MLRKILPKRQGSQWNQSRTWVLKVAEAIRVKDGRDADAEEVQALGLAYAALEQRQAADVALSETHVYVLSPAGTVVLSKALPCLQN